MLREAFASERDGLASMGSLPSLVEAAAIESFAAPLQMFHLLSLTLITFSLTRTP